MDPDICFICEQQLKEAEKVRTLQKRAIQTLISASIQRQDNKHGKYKLNHKECVTVHEKCSLSYIAAGNIKACQRLKEAQFGNTSTRAKPTAFDFDKKCLYCGTDASDKFIKHQAKKSNVSKRQGVRKVTMENSQDNILRRANERSDKWGSEVLNRVGSATSLIAVQARYHTRCNVRFAHSKSATDQLSEDTPDVIELIERFVKNHPDEGDVPLNEILVGYEGEAANKQQLRKKLYERLADDIIITSNKSSQPIIHLRDNRNKILLQSFEDSQNRKSDRIKIVAAAAKIIAEDIRASECDGENYPPADSSMENIEEVIPDSLRIFLDNVILSDKRGTETSELLSKTAAIAHTIISSIGEPVAKKKRTI